MKTSQRKVCHFTRRIGGVATFFAATVLATVGNAGSSYMDFGTPDDFNPESPMYIIKSKPDRSKVWSWKKTTSGFNENGSKFYWIKTPANKSGYTDSRGLFFRRSMKIRIPTDGFPRSGPLYLTVRFKDNMIATSKFSGVPLWGRGLLGTLGGANDHRWKTTTIEVNANRLTRSGSDFIVRLGANYTDQHAGEIHIDKIKLSTTRDTSEFEPDSAGLWPVVAASNSRFSNIGETNEYIPGEGPFFPFGIYLQSSSMTHGGTASSPGRGPRDTYQIMENAQMNTAIIHGWSQNWYSRWKTYPSHQNNVWGAPGEYVEMGLDEALIHAQGHGIKIIPNFLTDTRAYWILKHPDGAPEALSLISDVIRDHSNHPAILGWNPVDEWDHEGVSHGKPQLFSRQLYAASKKNDPNRPVYISLMGFGGDLSWKVAAAAGDVFSNDSYFDDGKDLVAGARTQASRLDDMRAVLGSKKAIISIPHFGERRPRQRDYNGTPRMPNETEVLFQAYYSVIHGAQGLVYFRFVHPSATGYTGLDSAWAGMNRLGSELFGESGIAHALIAPSKVLDIMGEQGVVSSSNSNIDFSLRETSYGAVILLAVNMVQTPQKTTFKVKGVSDGTKEVLFDGRSVRVVGGRFSDSFARFERRVYVLEGKIQNADQLASQRSVLLKETRKRLD